jgi:drug/metabolite transporter (DMT)-like permease
VFLGWLVAHEPVSSRTVIAAAVILAGVAIITLARDSQVKQVNVKRAAA